MRQSKTILLAGGGTGGPTTPLLAVAEALKRIDPELKLIFAGTTFGPEKVLVERAGLVFVTIPSAKFRRYFSLKNFVDIFILPVSVFKAWLILRRFKIDVIVSAGGYVAVPFIWAAALSRTRVLIHQQDIVPSLANKLARPFADRITVTFAEQLKNFPAAVLTGNPVREFVLRGHKEKGLARFGFGPSKPLVFVYGGGSGSLRINQLIQGALPALLDADLSVLHQTGKNIDQAGQFLEHVSRASYRRLEFLTDEVGDAYAMADVVVSRAGMGNISELSYLGKAAIVIPIPNSHQEKNAEVLQKHGAAVVLQQDELTPEKLFNEIMNLVNDQEKQKIISKNIFNLMPHGAADTIASLVYNLV